MYLIASSTEDVHIDRIIEKYLCRKATTFEVFLGRSEANTENQRSGVQITDASYTLSVITHALYNTCTTRDGMVQVLIGQRLLTEQKRIKFLQSELRQAKKEPDGARVQ